MAFIYFAYGSNMLVERLRQRCPNAEVIGPGIAEGFRVAFCLTSMDGSAKAGLLASEGAQAGGVLFSIPEAEGPALDKVEGHPHTYERHETLMVASNGHTYEALTYIPHNEKLAENLAPYDWYKALCLAGAEENGVPARLVAELAGVRPKVTDLGNAKASTGREIAHRALRAAGRDDLVRQLV